MQIYLAPLEGITGYAYRQAVHECFGGFDKYFIPFIRAKQNLRFSSRETKDILPENNKGMYAVPQILTRNGEDFVHTAEQIREYGYKEINLNLGCPSRTVVSKGCGAGFLDDPVALDRFLDYIFRECHMEISIKTRIGMEDSSEFSDLLRIYNRYPVKELIIHPRLQKEFYKGVPHLDVFEAALSETELSVCYNGDIFSREDAEHIKKRFPNVDCIMTGRGVLSNPALAKEIRTGQKLTKKELKDFHDRLYASYRQNMSGDRNVLFKMKEIWAYLGPAFTENKKYLKKIKKSEKCAVYESVVSELFATQELITDTNNKGVLS